MAVREALLTLLAVEPTYGFRLHTELVRRLPHRKSLNVGQSYATLERSQTSGLVSSAGNNEDGLPVFQLTEAGMTLVRDWLLGNSTPRPSVEETSDRILLCLTLAELLPNAMPSINLILSEERSRWSRAREVPPDTAGSIEQLAGELSQAQAAAVSSWLARISLAEPSQWALAFDANRPRRGRPKRGA